MFEINDLATGAAVCPFASDDQEAADRYAAAIERRAKRVPGSIVAIRLDGWHVSTVPGVSVLWQAGAPVAVAVDDDDTTGHAAAVLSALEWYGFGAVTEGEWSEADEAGERRADLRSFRLAPAPTAGPIGK